MLTVSCLLCEMIVIRILCNYTRRCKHTWHTYFHHSTYHVSLHTALIMSHHFTHTLIMSHHFTQHLSCLTSSEPYHVSLLAALSSHSSLHQHLSCLTSHSTYHVSSLLTALIISHHFTQHLSCLITSHSTYHVSLHQHLSCLTSPALSCAHHLGSHKIIMSHFISLYSCLITNQYKKVSHVSSLGPCLIMSHGLHQPYHVCTSSALRSCAVNPRPAYINSHHILKQPVHHVCIYLHASGVRHFSV